MSILFSIIIFGVIILFHEFGHFIVAKKNHVVVTEFALGMGPKIISREKDGTVYSLRAFPVGGFCAMLGETGEAEGPGSFGGSPVWVRIAIVAAGPLFNFLLAWIMACVLVGSAGVDKTVLLDVSEGYPAQEAGMAAGDEILSIGGKRVYFYREITDYVNNHQKQFSTGKPVRIVYRHEGEKKTADLVPMADENGRYKLGIVGSMYYRQETSLPETLLYGAAEVRYWINATFEGIKMMFTGQVGLEAVSGPVRVVEVIGDAYEESRQDGAFYVWLNMLNIAILLSANLGVMNLLPIPALDGGRLLIFLVEALRGKRLDPQVEGRIVMVGFAFVIALMVVVVGNDVRSLFVR